MYTIVYAEEQRMVHNLAYHQGELAKWEAALSELAMNGQSYSVTGSHSKTAVTPAACLQMIGFHKRAIFRLHGISSTTLPDFNGGHDSGNNPVPEAP